MTSFKVAKEGGVEINGAEYAEGHIFTFESDVPSHIRACVDDGSIVEVDLSEQKENTMTEENEQKDVEQTEAGQSTEGDSSNTAGDTQQSDTGVGAEGAGEEKAAE